MTHQPTLQSPPPIPERPKPQAFPFLTKKDVKTFYVARACFQSTAQNVCDHQCHITLTNRQSISYLFKDYEIRLLSNDFKQGKSAGEISISSDLDESHFSSPVTESILNELPPIRNGSSGYLLKSAIKTFSVVERCFSVCSGAPKNCTHSCSIVLKEEKTIQFPLRGDQIRLIWEELSPEQRGASPDMSHFRVSFTEETLTRAYKEQNLFLHPNHESSSFV